jgi:WhiB family transcriptional regulator, redox-sensing transcriptional regulator
VDVARLERRRRALGGTAAGALDPIGRHAPLDLPCQVHDADLWFSDDPADLERAKTLCAGCPTRPACLAGALHRRERTGVWGGQIIQDGMVVPYKRVRGRPPKNAQPAGDMSVLAAG